MFKFLNKDYRYFRKKLKGVDFMILDLEFKRYKTQEIRNEVHSLYDSKKAELLALEEKVKKERKEKKLPEGDIKRIEDDVERSKAEIKKFEEQLKGLDAEIYGLKPSADFPQGHQGIEDQIEALHELQEMLKDYMTKL